MKKNKDRDKKVYLVTVIIAIFLLALLLVFVNIQYKGSDKTGKTSTNPTTTKKILKDVLMVDDKKVDIEVDEFKTPWGIAVKYEPLYFKVGADDKILKFTSVVDKNTYLVIEKMTKDEYTKAHDLKGREEEGDYIYIRRVIKNGNVYLKVTKCHKNGVENDNIDVRMEYILKQLS